MDITDKVIVELGDIFTPNCCTLTYNKIDRAMTELAMPLLRYLMFVTVLWVRFVACHAIIGLSPPTLSVMIMKMNYSLNESEMLGNINTQKESEWSVIRLHRSG